MNRTPPFPGLVPIRKVEQVVIPTTDGQGIARTVDIEVDAWLDQDTNETYLDAEAIEVLDRAKARHLGILSPDELRQLRRRLGQSQKSISELLQIGEKTWTRWESGRERPSRAMNVLLRALRDGRLDIHYLACLRDDPTRAGRILEFDPSQFGLPYRYGPGRRTVAASEGQDHEANALAS